MRKFPVVYMRGGTSKGIMFLEKDLPGREEWDDIFVQCMGSPDPKQIDGVGGCVSSNNKIVVVRPSERPGVDVDYIVGQSIVGQSKIDYKSNCGNMTAATAPYAVEMGLVENLTEPVTTVHMFNLNTNKYIDVDVPVKDGQFNNEGDCAIAGIDGTAGELRVNFLNPAGSKTGMLFPTGNVQDVLEIPELGEIRCTILDVSNPIVLVRAEDLGASGTELPAAVDSDKKLAAAHFFIGVELVKQLASVDVIGYLRRQFCPFAKAVYPADILVRDEPEPFAEPCLRAKPYRNGLSVQQLIIGNSFYRSADRMPEVEHLTQTAFALVLHNDLVLDLAVML